MKNSRGVTAKELITTYLQTRGSFAFIVRFFHLLATKAKAKGGNFLANFARLVIEGNFGCKSVASRLRKPCTFQLELRQSFYVAEHNGAKTKILHQNRPFLG